MTLREERRHIVMRRQALAKILEDAGSFKGRSKGRSIAPRSIEIRFFAELTASMRLGSVHATPKEMARRRDALTLS